MLTPNDLHGQIEATLSQLGAFVAQRDLAVLSEFASDAILVGSDDGEIAEGVAELRTLFVRVYAQAATISWEWETISAAASGNVAWFFANGHFVATGAEGQKRLPYRLAGVCNGSRIAGYGGSSTDRSLTQPRLLKNLRSVLLRGAAAAGLGGVRVLRLEAAAHRGRHIVDD